MIFKIVFATVLLVLVAYSNAKVYDKCEFARTMRDNGIPKEQLGTWTCIASHESNFNTKAINDKTWDYGILQISSIYWCSDTDQPGKGCNVRCKDLLSDDISNSIACAKKVFEETVRIRKDGFTAWTVYKNCQGDQWGWVADCGL